MRGRINDIGPKKDNDDGTISKVTTKYVRRLIVWTVVTSKLIFVNKDGDFFELGGYVLSTVYDVCSM